MNDIERDGIGTVVTEAVEAAATDTEAVYVTFDIDGVDPSVAPGTGTPVPGGDVCTRGFAGDGRTR